VLGIALMVAGAALGGACEEASGVTAPDITGTIAGSVTINGAGTAGITVSLSTGQTATTSATGQYTFVNVPAGVFTVAISGYPSDVSFPATVQAAVVTTAGQAVVVNFSGARIGLPPITHTGTLSLAGGDPSHNPFVFNAPQPKSVSLLRQPAGTTGIRLTPVSGFSPSALPELTGTVDEAGAVSVSGSGTIANNSSVSVTATGTLINGKLDVTITVGADGRLPGGQPIRYRYADN
jgi:hypothetical protein